MADIDFDELDKAVNNLMGGVKDKDKTPEPRTVDLESTIDPNEKPSFEKLNDAVKEVGQEGEKPAEPEVKPDEKAPEPPKVNLASRPKPSGGRFMDVVHPSADMRTPAPEQPVARHGRTIMPDGANVTPEQVSDTAEPDTQTPFLPDANEKISKRPLGAVPSPFSDSPHEDTETAKKDEPAKPEIVEPEPAKSQPLGDELTKEHEPEKGMDEPPVDPTHIEAEPTDQDRVLQSIESMEVEGSPAGETAEVSDESIRHVESGDTENLRTGGDEDVKKKDKKSDKDDKQASGIYDVKDYHKPLNHGAKTKSGWGTVVVIVAIIVICIALAASAFFILGGGL